MRYHTLLCDPPWQYVCWSERGEGKGAARHYECQGTDWICSLPVPEVVERDAVLLLWATNPLLPEAWKVLEAWGFSYKSLITWVKMSRLGAVRMGCGYHVRSCTEQIIIATRREPRAPAPAVRPQGVLFHPSGEHSRKPEAQYELAENYAGPWLEMFSRPRDGMFPPREGWTRLGDSVDGRDMHDALRDLSCAPAPPRAQHTPKEPLT